MDTSDHTNILVRTTYYNLLIHHHRKWKVITIMVDKEQLDRIEKKLDELDEKLDEHIKEIWTVYVPIKKLLEKLERFKIW